MAVLWRHAQPPAFKSNWLDEASAQLDAIERLPSGWDSHGAASPSADIARGARALLESLSTADGRLAKPHVHPTPSGGVQLHWESGSCYFEVELTDAQHAHFYFTDRSVHEETEGDLRIGDSLSEVLSYARRSS
jgi:hypothetical protein